MPVAVNCWVIPEGTLGIVRLAGITDIEERVAEFTVNVVFPEIVPKVPVIIVVPDEMAMARPLLLIVATDVSEELQVTCAVIT